MSYPVAHISYSSFRKFHTDMGGWKEEYIMGNRIFKPSPSMIVGSSCHSVIDAYMGGVSLQDAINTEYARLNSIKDEDIKWGKTGSRAKMLQDFSSAIQLYFDEMPEYGEIIAHEKEYKGYIEDAIGGISLKSLLPLMGKIDLEYREGGKRIIEDFKFTSKHSDVEADGINPSYMTQAIFYFLLVRQYAGETPHLMRFREIKTSKNKDKSSQHQVVEIDFSSEEFEQARSIFWYQLMGMCRFIENANEESYFPFNIFDQMSGKDSFYLLNTSQFGYNLGQARESSIGMTTPQAGMVPTAMISTRKADLKEARFIESKAPDTIEGKIVYKYQEHGIALTYEKMQEGYAFDRYLFVPSRGVKMSEVKKYAEDVSQATEMENVIILAPVPGTKYIGVEVPRADRKYTKFKNECMPIGRDISKKLYSLDLSNPDTPHVLIAGKSGSGKSQLIRTLIETRPKGTQLVCIDPKRVELGKYRKESLLFAMLPEETLLTLQNIIMEMSQRYTMMEANEMSDIGSLRPRMMIVIDEYASLRLDPHFGKEIEKLLIQITNMGRAAGIHLIIATQRPSVDVISGLIKANIGCRICLAVASQIDSKVVLDQNGAEKLAGKGDLLYMYPGQDPVRLQALTA